MNNYILLNESKISRFEETTDVEFLLEFGSGDDKILTNYGDDHFKVNFVGEIETPNKTYFSFPKNVENDPHLIPIIKKCIDKIGKSKNGRDLIFSGTGNYNSEKLYFNKLKSYFLDYITYEFIYPSKRKIVHTNKPKIGSRIDVMLTQKNIKRYGDGLTYKVKDFSNDDTWLLDDIYYHTIIELMDRTNATMKDKSDIDRMYKYLLSEGFNINNKDLNNKIISNTGEVLCDLSKTNEVLDKIKKSDVGIIHIPIKETLINYYQDKLKSSANISANIIFTSKFEKTLEYMIFESLIFSEEIRYMSNHFREELEDKLKAAEIHSTLISKNDEKYSNLPITPEETKNLEKWVDERGGRYFYRERKRRLIPDIIVDFGLGKRFIGDAKYYKNPLTYYDKEMYNYNVAMGNKYPIVIFASADKKQESIMTIPQGGYRTDDMDDNEILISFISIPKLMDDFLNKTGLLADGVKIFIGKYFKNSKNWI